MYATASAAEQYVSKNYGSKFDISELHGAVALSSFINIYNDVIGYYNSRFNVGGDFCFSAQYFTNWNEPIGMSCSWNSVISGATDETYKVTDNDFLRYIRVAVSSKNKYGNVEYPCTVYSDATAMVELYLGDVNLDGEVTIADVTLLQKYISDMVDLNKEQLLTADADKNGSINIDDATTIQKVLVDIITF